MSLKTSAVIASTIALFCWSVAINAQMFKSGTEKNQLIELFSSQGCSSCPPAQHFLNKLGENNKLWDDLVPVVFHVDYWDYLGWKDPYSSSAFSQRQREYKSNGQASAVYTPGFFVNGKEWKGFFVGKPFPRTYSTAGELVVLVEDDKFVAEFEPIAEFADATLVLNISVLAMNRVTSVSHGENRNKTLEENFISLSLDTFESQSGWWSGSLELPLYKTDLAISAWVTEPESSVPIQATGGLLNY